MKSTYQHAIESAPEYAILTVRIPQDETLKVEASAMASMDTNIHMKTKVKGGLSRLLAKESVFMNEFTAHGGSGEIKIAPGPAGDLGYCPIAPDREIYLTASSFVACTPGVKIDTKFQGLAKGFFSGESLFIMKCSGQGDLWFNAYGAIFPIDIDGEYVVDTGHIVGFTTGLDYQISKVGGYKSLFFSGEGFVCRFRGEGKVWVQTRNPLGLISWANRFRLVKKKN